MVQWMKKGFAMLELLQVGQTVLFCIFGLVLYFVVKPAKTTKSIF